MRTLHGRRFPDVIERARTAEGMRDASGEYVPGVTTTATLRANVQPLVVEDVDATGGEIFRSRLKCFIPYGSGIPRGVFSAAFSSAFNMDRGTAEPVEYDDKLTIEGVSYAVESLRPWPRHIEAIVIHED